MKAALVAAFSVSLAVAISAQQTVEVPRSIPEGGDITILQYALTLENLESTFYDQALKKWDDDAFRRAGYASWVRERFVEISKDENKHVEFLTDALGPKATKACTYYFPYDTIEEFITLSHIFEGVGVSAYLGAAASVSSAEYLTIAASILTVEARHSAVVSEIQGEFGFPAPFDTPLGFSPTYTLGAQFIDHCPASNPSFPFKVFPEIEFRTQNLEPGHNFAISFDPQGVPASNWRLQILNGLNRYVVPINARGIVKLPANLQGRAYVIVTRGDVLSDATTIAGPGIMDFEIRSGAPAMGNHQTPAKGHWHRKISKPSK